MMPDSPRIPCCFAGCKKTFSTLKIRKVHIDRCHSGKKFQCSIENCEKKLASKFALQRHIISVHGQTFSNIDGTIVQVPVDDPLTELEKDSLIEKRKHQIDTLENKLRTVQNEVKNLRTQLKIKNRIVNRLKSRKINKEKTRNQ